MDLKKITRFTFILVIIGFLTVQCKEPDKQAVPCDCQSKTVKKEMKNIEAVVVYIQGNRPPGGSQGPDLYILSNEPKDFERSGHAAGPNILVPCDSLSTEFKKQGLKVVISYNRKDCYGAITNPSFRGHYGYFIDLTTIRVKNL